MSCIRDDLSDSMYSHLHSLKGTNSLTRTFQNPKAAFFIVFPHTLETKQPGGRRALWASSTTRPVCSRRRPYIPTTLHIEPVCKRKKTPDFYLSEPQNSSICLILACELQESVPFYLLPLRYLLSGWRRQSTSHARHPHNSCCNIPDAYFDSYVLLH